MIAVDLVGQPTFTCQYELDRLNNNGQAAFKQLMADIRGRLRRHLGRESLDEFCLAVSELFSNAVKYRPDSTWLTVSLYYQRGSLRLLLFDNGAGQDPNWLERAREGYRARLSTTGRPNRDLDDLDLSDSRQSLGLGIYAIDQQHQAQLQPFGNGIALVWNEELRGLS